MVMFVSEAYLDKSWPTHERKSAQARALVDKKGYILPAFFDESVKVPALLETIGRISLEKKTPKQVADLIIKKLAGSGIDLPSVRPYWDEAIADVDFPLPKNGKVAKIIRTLKIITFSV